MSNKYIAEDGLMKLHPGENRDPYPGQQKMTVGNDNGILYLAYYMWLKELNNDLTNAEKDSFVWTVKRLRVAAGLFARNPGRTDRYESLDNYVGIVAGSALSGGISQVIAREICTYGFKYGWTYDNVKPNRFNLKRWRQGADVAFYKLCAGWAPSIYEFIWLIGGVIFNAFQSFKDKNGVERLNTSEHLMTWLRLRAIERSSVNSNAPKLMFEITALARAFWVYLLKRKTKGKGMEHVFHLFFSDPEHPNRLLSRGVVY